jgi:hypothetical protein
VRRAALAADRLIDDAKRRGGYLQGARGGDSLSVKIEDEQPSQPKADCPLDRDPALSTGGSRRCQEPPRGECR